MAVYIVEVYWGVNMVVLGRGDPFLYYCHYFSVISVTILIMMVF